MKWLTILVSFVLVLGLPVQSRAAVAVTVSPNSVQVSPGSQVQFSAAIAGTPTLVIWNVTGAGCSGITCGTITASGLYTAPASVPNPSSVTVTAIAVFVTANPGNASVTIQAQPNVGVTVSPALAPLVVNGQQQFSATVTGTVNTAVTWSVSGSGCVGNSCGTITSSGLYTAPSTIPIVSLVTVTAKSAADPTKSASATVVIQSSSTISVSVVPNTAQVPAGGQQQFSAAVTGTSNTAVTWSVSGAGCAGAACGTINSAGFYTAPATAPNPPSVTIKATSVAAPGQSGAASVSIGATGGLTVSPAAPQVKLGGQVQFSATVTGSTSGVVLWSVSGSGCSGITCGSINASGLYTAPAVAPNPPTATVTATLLSNPPKSATATVTLGSSGAAVGITISPTSASMKTGGQQQFQATVTGSANTSVNWSVSGVGCAGAACGTVSSTGLYTAPPTVPPVSLVTVKATSVADATKSASSSVSLSTLVIVSVSPKSMNLAPGAQQQFAASVSGTANLVVTWSATGAGCSGLGCGSINGNGLYTAPTVAPASAVTITATSQADSTKSDTASVSIIVPVSVSVSPTSIGVTVGQQQQFGASVAGSANGAVNWSLAGAGCGGATCGTVSSTGLYTAPSSVPSPATVTLTATSQADLTKFASAVITVQPTNNSKLNGQYAFLLKEFDLFGAYVAAGTITADGNGNLTGIEDVNRALGPLVNAPITGTYKLGGDNRGTMTITNSQGSLTFAFALGTTGKNGRLVSFDNSGVRGTGILRKQDPSAFSTFALASGYTLNLTGRDFSAQRVGILASIFPNGFNAISGSALDYNDGGSVQTFGTFNGPYTVGVNGRGTMTFNILGIGPLDFAIYVVSAQEMILVSTDQLSPFNPVLAGLGEQQSGGPYLSSSFQGSAVFNVAGLNSGFGEGYVGRMTFDGNGNVTAQYDLNRNGTITIGGTFTGTYTIAPNGRGSLNLFNAANQLSIWTFYAIAPNRAYLQEPGFTVAQGEMKSQGVNPPFDNADLAGQLIFGSGEPPAIDAKLFTGVEPFNGGTVITGTEDISQLVGQSSSQVLGGTFQVSLVSNNGRGIMLLTSPSSASVATWLISASEMVAMDVDSGNAEPTILFFEQ